MPARNETFVCTCQSCLLNGGRDANGIPIGISHPVAHREAHLVRVHAEAEARRASDDAAKVQAERNLVGDITLNIFTSTLLDEGPNLESQPSRLWSSREEFQASRSASSPNPDTVEHLVDGILNVHLHAASAIDDTAGDIGQIDLVSENRPRAVRSNFESSETRREQNKHTHTAHQILNIIEKRARTCASHLDDLESILTSPATATDQTIPTSEHPPLSEVEIHSILSAVEGELAKAVTALENVKRSVGSVDARKEAIAPNLEDLQARYAALRRAHPVVDNKPLEFDTCMCPNNVLPYVSDLT